jgi:integrase/recombinase XerC
MTNEELMPTYVDGERSCPICSEPLPAHQTWPGARYRFCGSPTCAPKVKGLQKGRYIEANSVKCEAPDCDAYIPEGRYTGRSVFVACSPECHRKRALKGSMEMTCDCGCGNKFSRASKRGSVTGLVFLSNEHRVKYVREQYATDSFGGFLDVVDRFFAENVPLRYRNDRWIRHSLGPFFRFLLAHNIASLEGITPQTITQYLLWAEQMEPQLLPILCGPYLRFCLRPERRRGTPIFFFRLRTSLTRSCLSDWRGVPTMAELAHLHLHTDYSLLDGACEIERLMAHIRRLAGM